MKYSNSKSLDQATTRNLINKKIAHRSSKIDIELKEKVRVLSDEEILDLFGARCEDLGFKVNLEQLGRFTRNIAKNSYNGKLRL